MNSAGRRNMPCGEVFTGPVEDSGAERSTSEYPPRLRDARSRAYGYVRGGEGRRGERGEGEEYLRSLLDADAGARYLGGLGSGPTTVSAGRARMSSSTRSSAGQYTLL